MVVVTEEDRNMQVLQSMSMTGKMVQITMLPRPESSPDALWEQEGLKKIPGASKRNDRVQFTRKNRVLQEKSEQELCVIEEKTQPEKEPVSEKDLIAILGKALSRMASTTKFHVDFSGAAIPRISLGSYLKRMVRYLNEWYKSKSCTVAIGTRVLVMAMVYIDRICEKNSDLVLATSNIHRICMIAVLTAVKFTEDVPFPNSFWARVGGVTLTELNRMERSFLQKIAFDLQVSPQAFDKTFELLVKFA
mmetsp:Transcript_8966/g.14600  ORF Transcript_8966/g.14600 Transcript_8966/m.14600 type:complete len:248 (+) Transcript_8966:510-1253(+)|eukprot:CAMPEP_0203747612 /NCGR_PEP_ID=MMETSP0098-20131031/2704_1 /ASSEMBLY_ACC=CAM_ASM_000208 /TAXON_ID=96639 /ORGANISM=" , Strain NY0313808BC1" /LENGTH=247 /DNA_ID=CAMNT_0050636073 /DNA_START=612 /DNA_END=1355 /DNA_ORIENTATION=-